MARSVLVVTDSYQLASAKTAVFTIKKEGKGTIFFNTVNIDDDAAEALSRGSRGEQIEQRSTVNTYIRASEADAGWEIIIDE